MLYEQWKAQYFSELKQRVNIDTKTIFTLLEAKEDEMKQDYLNQKTPEESVESTKAVDYLALPNADSLVNVSYDEPDEASVLRLQTDALRYKPDSPAEVSFSTPSASTNSEDTEQDTPETTEEKADMSFSVDSLNNPLQEAARIDFYFQNYENEKIKGVVLEYFRDYLRDMYNYTPEQWAKVQNTGTLDEIIEAVSELEDTDAVKTFVDNIMIQYYNRRKRNYLLKILRV